MDNSIVVINTKSEKSLFYFLVKYVICWIFFNVLGFLLVYFVPISEILYSITEFFDFLYVIPISGILSMGAATNYYFEIFLTFFLWSLLMCFLSLKVSFGRNKVIDKNSAKLFYIIISSLVPLLFWFVLCLLWRNEFTNITFVLCVFGSIFATIVLQNKIKIKCEEQIVAKKEESLMVLLFRYIISYSVIFNLNVIMFFMSGIFSPFIYILAFFAVNLLIHFLSLKYTFENNRVINKKYVKLFQLIVFIVMPILFWSIFFYIIYPILEGEEIIFSVHRIGMIGIYVFINILANSFLKKEMKINENNL